MEEKEEKSAFKAAQLCDTFRRSFLRMSYTVHPANIPGEAQGKSSNESWAAKQALKHYTDVDVKRNAIFTTMDGRSPRLSLFDHVLKRPAQRIHISPLATSARSQSCMSSARTTISKPFTCRPSSLIATCTMCRCSFARLT